MDLPYLPHLPKIGQQIVSGNNEPINFLTKVSKPLFDLGYSIGESIQEKSPRPTLSFLQNRFNSTPFSPKPTDTPKEKLSKLTNFALSGTLDTGLKLDTKEVVSKLIASIKTAKPIRQEAQALYTAERAKRAAVGIKALETPGEKGFFKALGALKGELPKPKFETPRTAFNQEEVDHLFDVIKQHPTLDFFDKINASTGLSKLLGVKAGGIPTDSELKLLRNVYGQELIDVVRSKRPTWDKLKEGAAEVLNVPRALVASMDMSAPFRQGRVLASYAPKQFSKSFGEMFKYFGSEKIFQAAMDDIARRPTSQLMKQSGLSLTDITGGAIGLTNKEEGFMSNLAARLPLAGRLVKASERAYVGFLNKLRADVFDDLAKQYIDGGISPEQNAETFKRLADFINTASGRGNLGKLNQAAPLLNAVFFSPRFMAARVQMLNPAWYIKQPPVVRKEAAKAFAGLVGSGIAVLGLAKLGGAEVETDPRSTDFGKIKLGNIRYDTWAGFQQWVRLIAQEITGEVKTASGNIRKLDKTQFPYESRLDQGQKFFEGKLAPVPALIADLLRGQSLVGEPITWSKEIYEKLIPLYIQDIKDAVKDTGLKGGIKVGLPAFFGVGTQTYENKTKPGKLPELPGLPKLPKLNQRFNNQSTLNDSGWEGSLGQALSGERKSGLSPIQGVEPLNVQHNAQQARIVELERILMDPKLTQKEKAQQIAKLQFDDLPVEFLSQI